MLDQLQLLTLQLHDLQIVSGALGKRVGDLPFKRMGRRSSSMR
jgi:hypothetical protein